VSALSWMMWSDGRDFFGFGALILFFSQTINEFCIPFA
jgi:hypothetical protein